MKNVLGLETKNICLIVEDQPSMREHLSTVAAKAFPDFDIKAVNDIRSATEWLNQHNKKTTKEVLSFCMVDLGLPDGSGVSLLRLLQEQAPEARAVVVTIYDDDSYLFDALAAGASGYLLKEESQEYLVEALMRLQNGEPPLSPSIARRLLTHFQNTPKVQTHDECLSAREKETLTLLARGMTVPEAATQMGLSAQTVAGYVKIIYQKLHVSNRVEAVREALRRGIV